MSKELDVSEIAVEGYAFLYPLVMMEVTRRQILMRDPRSREQRQSNLFLHNHKMATDKWRSVARSNIDTLFSSAWIDLSDGPTTITLPPSGDRYHMFQMLDMWTDTYAVVGSRTIGTGGATFTLVGPRDSHKYSSTSKDIVIHCPTPTTWIIGRTYAQHGEDLQHAIEFVDSVIATSQSSQEFCSHVPLPESVDPQVPPVTQVRQMSGHEFLEFASHLVTHEGIRNTDGSIALRLRALGFIPGQPFDSSVASPDIQAAISDAPRVANQRIRQLLDRQGAIVNGWSRTQGDIGTYGNSYLLRAAIAYVGLAANPTVDAVYIGSIADSDGKKLDGSNTYRIHFEKGELPPGNAFWSVTAYDREGFMMSNRLDRFGIRSRDAVEMNADGSLDIYAGPECPPSSPECNWIPTIAGPIALQIRLYTPGESYLDGSWKPAPIQRVFGDN